MLGSRLLTRISSRGRGSARPDRPRPGRRRLARAARRGTETLRWLRGAARAIAEPLSYRPREVATVALLAGGLLVGHAVHRWREAYPALAERLEAEPPRVVAIAPAPPRRPPRVASRTIGPDCPEPLPRGDGHPGLEPATSSPTSPSR